MIEKIKRRNFLVTSAVATTGIIQSSAFAQESMLHKETAKFANQQFPNDFCWGVATSALQIEGAVKEGGRKPSVWETFSSIPEHIINNDTPTIACNHYHLYKEDVELMVRLGVKNYRFSIAWPRIIPDGRGKVNEEGVDFYKRLVDYLHDHGITPYATLYHWDTPQALEDLYGSWQNRQMAYDYADYVTAVVKRLGSRITNWMTLNEIMCFTHLSYAVEYNPTFAPGKRVSNKKEIWQTSHHALLAHGLGCQAIRAASPVPCKVALVDNIIPTIPISESPANIAAAKNAFHVAGQNGGIIFPALTGAYSPAMLELLGKNAPDIKPGDLKIIHQPLDAIGINIYTGCYARAADNPKGYEILDFSKDYPRMSMPWLNIVPESIYWGIRHISETLGRNDLPVFITENGCAAPDEENAKGEIIDTDRIMYLRQYLKSAGRALNERYPLKGYFLWSLMDNFEWSSGYSKRFGITYVNYATQKRIPKASFDWYAECIRQNRIV